MKMRDRLLVLTVFMLFLFSARAAIFDPGVALKANMAQETPTNPYTDLNGGVWMYGMATAATNGTVSTLTKTTTVWSQSLRGLSGSSDLPTIHVNTGIVATAGGGLTSSQSVIEPGELAVHPNSGNSASRYAIVRCTIPHTGLYHIVAVFRDVSVGYDGGAALGVDVYVAVNGVAWTNTVVSRDQPAPPGSVPSFFVEYRSQLLNAGDTVDCVVGPNGTTYGAFYNDGTAVRFSITAQIPHQDSIINLDFNGFQASDKMPGTNTVYTGSGAVGADGDYWNNLAVSDTNRTCFATPCLKLRDGITNSTVRVTLESVDANPLGGDYDVLLSTGNPMMKDYVYISSYSQTATTNRFVISGLMPGAFYDLYLYSRTKGRFEVNGFASDCLYAWFSTNGTADYVAFSGVPADNAGSITGLFYRTGTALEALFNGLQIVGAIPLQSDSEIVNLDIDGYAAEDTQPTTEDTYAGPAGVGIAGDYWNSIVVRDNTVTNISLPKLRLADGERRSTVNFTLNATGGSKLRADRNAAKPYNSLLDDYVWLGSQTNQFAISGLLPFEAYDIYFFGRAGNVPLYGRFIINGVVYDSIDYCFPISDVGGDCAACPAVTADGNGTISGLFCCYRSILNGGLNGFQIIGKIPIIAPGTCLKVR